ncbi:hypothetical protein ACX80J_07000 [Arthrobacter sp. MDB2-24]
MTVEAEYETLDLSSVTLNAAIDFLDRPPHAPWLETGSNDLPGVNLVSYTIHDIREPFFQTEAEPYLFGVAVDSTLKPVPIPWGLADFDPNKFQLKKVGQGAKVTFGDSTGAPLYLPPVKDFLAIVLMIADSDNAQGSIEVLKGAAAIAKNDKVIGAIGAANPAAGAALVAAGLTLDAAAAGLKANRDDIIADFRTMYFTSATLVPGRRHKLVVEGAEMTLRVGEDPNLQSR